jgi:hypothetical protein
VAEAAVEELKSALARIFQEIFPGQESVEHEADAEAAGRPR